MTPRAILLGLVGACTICGFTYINDVLIGQTSLVGHFMPISVYGALILFVLFINPILFVVWKKLALDGKELAVILTLILAACCVPGSGLIRTLVSTPIVPYYLNSTETGWPKQQVVEMTPNRMLVDLDFNEIVLRGAPLGEDGACSTLLGKIIAADEHWITIQDLEGQEHQIPRNQVSEVRDVGKDLVLGGYLKGLPRENLNEHISPREIPWYAWVRPLIFWLAVVGALWMSLIGLSLVVHRQWSDHEQLPYPLAQFTHALLPREGEARGGVFANGLFWLGAVPVLVIHLNNYANAWFPDVLIRIPTVFDVEFLFEAVPVLWQAHFSGGINAVQALMSLRFYFMVIGFAYFLPKDVSLSIGLGPYLFMWIAGISFQYGLWRGDAPHIPKIPNMLTCGAYVGVFLALLYTGRHYYFHTFCRALYLRRGADFPIQSVWGARVFLIGIVMLVVHMTAAGLDWQLAALYVLGLVVIFLVMSRILAETGMFYIMPWWSPGVLLLGFMGAKALSPQGILTMNIFAAVLVVSYDAAPAREALMPYLINALKLLDLRRINIGRSTVVYGLAVVAGVAVALPLTLYFVYDRGALTAGGYHINATRWTYAPVLRAKLELVAQDSLSLSNALSGWERFIHLRTDTMTVVCFTIGLALVLMFTAGRLRFARWPLHPVLFLVWITRPGRLFAASFLAGWLIKVAVMKYGGVGVYRKLIPLMFGIIAGEVMGGTIPMAVGLIYYWVTGEIPKTYRIML